MAWNFQVVGGGPNPFAPPQRTLTSAEMMRVLAWDPNYDMDHGRIHGTLRQLEAKRGMGGPTREAEILEWSLKVEPKRRNIRTYQNPARLPDWKRSRRPLTPFDLEFVRGFEGVEPGKVAADDVKLLAELEAVAESEPERRVVVRVLGPIRRFHDRKEEEAELLNEIDRHTPSGFRCTTVRDYWLPVLAERLAEENKAKIEPQLADLPSDVREKTLRTVETPSGRPTSASPSCGQASTGRPREG